MLVILIEIYQSMFIKKGDHIDINVVTLGIYIQTCNV